MIAVLRYERILELVAADAQVPRNTCIVALAERQIERGNVPAEP